MQKRKKTAVLAFVNKCYNYDIECSLSSLKTEGAVPPATETLETLPRPTSLLPCIA